MNPKTYRDREVLKIIESAFEQFKITDPNEKLDIQNSIKQQLDTANPVSTYDEDINASSATYRSNVRNALIDIISHLLSAKDAKIQLDQLEGVSRDVMSQAKLKLINFQKRLIGMSDKIKETFVEGLDIGNHTNTIIKEDMLRVNFLDKTIIPSNVDTVVFPADSYYDGVETTVTDNEDKLFKTGLGSDSFRVTTSSIKKPGSYIMGNFVEGIVTQFTIQSKSFTPRAISGKASTPFRIALWEGYNPNTEKWIVLGHDETLGQYSYIDTSDKNSYNTYRVSVLFPDSIKQDGKYFYEGVLHNIKLFERDSIIQAEKGTFLSHKYDVTENTIKIKFDAVLNGWVVPKLILDNDTTNPYYILPEGSHLDYNKYYKLDIEDNIPFYNQNYVMDFKYVTYWDGSAASAIGIEIPLTPKTQGGSSIAIDLDHVKVFGENNIEVEGEWSNSQNISWDPVIEAYVESHKYYFRPTSYTGYLFFIYALENDHLNHLTFNGTPKTESHELVLTRSIEQTDLHNKLDNFIYPLSSFPIREDNGELSSHTEEDYYYNNPTFSFFIVGGPGDGQLIEDIKEVFPTNGAVEFNDELRQFYYFNKKLYTNFNLYSWNNDNIRVVYNRSYNNIQVAFDLYNEGTVDEYSLEFIQATKPINLTGEL